LPDHGEPTRQKARSTSVVAWIGYDFASSAFVGVVGGTTQTLAFAMEELVVLFIVIQLAALGGALAWSAPTDRLGPKWV
jgi:hypothetical protein